MPVESIEECDASKGRVEIFASVDEMRRSLIKLCYGDLYVIGRIWIEALKTVLVGAKMSLIPVVNAAKPPSVPERPPPMKYTDLPIYQSPHYEYKDYVENSKKCPKGNVKMIHEFLLPHVKSFRESTQCSYCEFKCELKGMKKDICDSVNENKREFKKFMRDPKNLTMRQAVTVLGGVAGYYIGSGRGVPRRLFFSGLGLLTTGALCFPKETDEAFRNVVYHAGKFGGAIYNSTCGKEFSLRERLPCKDDTPPPPPPQKNRKPNPCPEKK